jgi:hypothetical protein
LGLVVVVKELKPVLAWLHEEAEEESLEVITDF